MKDKRTRQELLESLNIVEARSANAAAAYGAERAALGQQMEEMRAQMAEMRISACKNAEAVRVAEAKNERFRRGLDIIGQIINWMLDRPLTLWPFWFVLPLATMLAAAGMLMGA